MNPKEFEEALKEMKIDLTSLQKQQLETYYELLVEYNKVMNLTGIVEKEDVYLKHFYDSLTLARDFDFNKEMTLCDVGTGAGFPGMVLKICFPNLKITLVDSLKKRVEFLKKVVEVLGLQGIEVVPDRAEEYARIHRETFDFVTARAVAPLSTLLEYCIPILKIDGYFLPMKGILKIEEKETKAFSILHAVLEKEDCFFLPKENSKRTILVIRKMAKTPFSFPRKYAEMKKKPL